MMKKYTFMFELFGKKGKYTCYAANRKEADVDFSDMLLRNTRFESVLEEKDSRRQMGKDKIEDGFANFADIFGKDFLFFGK